MKIDKKNKGFTLLEILLVIALIGILAGIVLVAVNPNRQLAQARNLQRTVDINNINDAIELYTIKNKGINTLTINNTYTEICNTGTEPSSSSTTNCTGKLDLRALVPTYIRQIPRDPQVSSTSTGTGYELAKDNTNKISIKPKTSELLKNIGLNYPDELYAKAGALPNLDLNFARNKSLMDSVTGNNLVTFTRTSSGTYTDSNGVLRKAVTNLLLRSEDLTTTWSQYLLSSVTANTTVAPDGQTTADTVAYTADAFADINQGAASVVNGTTYTLSVWARSVSGTSAFRFKYWNGSAGVYSSAITLTETWQRYSYTFAATATSAGANVGFANTTAATRSVVFWGAQLEQSSTVGEYIPTTSTINSAPRFDHNPTTNETGGGAAHQQHPQQHDGGRGGWNAGDVTYKLGYFCY